MIILQTRFNFRPKTTRKLKYLENQFIGINSTLRCAANLLQRKILKIKMMSSIKRIFANKFFMGVGTAAILFFTIKGIAWLLVFYFGLEYFFSFLD